MVRNVQSSVVDLQLGSIIAGGSFYLHEMSLRLNLNFLALVFFFTTLLLVNIVVFFELSGRKSIVAILCLFIIKISALIVFASENLFTFVFGVELSILPLAVLAVDGYQHKKMKAVFSYILYGFISDAFIIVALFMLLSSTQSSTFSNLFIYGDYTFYQKCSIYALFFGLLIKVPVVPFHHWLLSAHVDMNVQCSVILSGVLLKFPIY